MGLREFFERMKEALARPLQGHVRGHQVYHREEIAPDGTRKSLHVERELPEEEARQMMEDGRKEMDAAMRDMDKAMRDGTLPDDLVTRLKRRARG